MFCFSTSQKYSVPLKRDARYIYTCISLKLSNIPYNLVFNGPCSKNKDFTTFKNEWYKIKTRYNAYFTVLFQKLQGRIVVTQWFLCFKHPVSFLPRPVLYINVFKDKLYRAKLSQNKIIFFADALHEGKIWNKFCHPALIMVTYATLTETKLLKV